MYSVRSHVLSVPIMVLFASFAAAQDPLEAARQQAALAAQKLRVEIKANLDDADRLAKTNPEKAREILRKNRTLLEEVDCVLPEVECKGYLADVNHRLNKITNRINAGKKADELAREKIGRA